MWPSKFESPLDLKPKKSLSLLFYLGIIHLLALSVMFMPFALPWPGRVLLGILIVLSFVHAYQHFILRMGSGSRVRLHWHSDGTWTLYNHTELTCEAQLLPSSYVTKWIVILHFACANNKRQRILLLADMFDPEIWRCLRVRLLYSDTARDSIERSSL